MNSINNHEIAFLSNTTVPSYNAHSLEAAICKTLALKVGNELNNGTIAPSSRRAFFKITYNVFLISSKKIPFEQYCRLHLSGPNVAICETKSNTVFVLTHTSFDQNNFCFLHVVQEAVDAFYEVLKNLGWLLMIRQNTLLNSTLLPTLKTSNPAFCSRFFIFADFLRSSFIFADFLRSSFIFADFLRSSLIFADFLRSSLIFADFLRSPIIFADFLCSSLNMNSLTFKLQNCFKLTL